MVGLTKRPTTAAFVLLLQVAFRERASLSYRVQSHVILCEYAIKGFVHLGSMLS